MFGIKSLTAGAACMLFVACVSGEDIGAENASGVGQNVANAASSDLTTQTYYRETVTCTSPSRVVASLVLDDSFNILKGASTLTYQGVSRFLTGGSAPAQGANVNITTLFVQNRLMDILQFVASYPSYDLFYTTGGTSALITLGQCTRTSLTPISLSSTQLTDYRNLYNEYQRSQIQLYTRAVFAKFGADLSANAYLVCNVSSPQLLRPAGLGYTVVAQLTSAQYRINYSPQSAIPTFDVVLSGGGTSWHYNSTPFTRVSGVSIGQTAYSPGSPYGNRVTVDLSASFNPVLDNEYAPQYASVYIGVGNEDFLSSNPHNCVLH